MTKYLMLVALVAALTKSIWAIDANCDYYQDVIAGSSYYVYSSEYPNSYSRARSCRWYAKGATNLRLSCEISLPATANCAEDRLSVSPSGNLQLTDAQNYCGTGSFNITSTGNNLNIVFTALRGTIGGTFLCNLEATTVTTPTCSCGWQKSNLKIVGGVPVSVNEYPMFAGVIDTQRQQVHCGGTIIAPKYVLTAAHCQLPNNQLRVLVGDLNTNTSTDINSSLLHAVSSWVSHPSYNSNTQANDIAVITVVDPIVFTMAAGPACLPFRAASSSFVGLKVSALGRGSLAFATVNLNTLLKVELDVITTSQCQHIFPNITDKQLCTYTPGKGTCQIDSGGPILSLNPNTGRLVSVGVVSYAERCGSSKPGVNTNVAAYLDWILSVTQGANYCRLE